MQRAATILFLLGFFGLSAQVVDVKVMTYNLMYYKAPSAPCTHNVPSATRDAAFQTVFKAAKPDILVVQELGAYADNSAAWYTLQNVINTQGEQNFISGSYSNNSFSSLTNQVFFDSTVVGLASQEKVEFEMGGQALVRVIDIYRMYLKDAGLSQGADTVFFTLAGLHLKAGNSSGDASDRQAATLALMNYLSNQVADDNIMILGDFNIYRSSEAAFQNLVNYSDARVRVQDPVNQLGSWNNNGSFALVHTQSTHSSSSGCFSGGGSDDRFDMILHTSALQNGTAHVKYKPGSYTILGQDGLHFNQSINSGTNNAVSSTVANALYDFSDHLPVFATYEVSPKGIGLEETDISGMAITNPFNQSLQLSRQAAKGELTYQVLNLAGQIICRGTMAANAEFTKINTQNWANGIYLLKLTNAQNQVLTRKLVKDNYAQN